MKKFITVDKFYFVNLSIGERHKFYKIINQLNIPYTKIRLFGSTNNVVHISLLINFYLRHNNNNYVISNNINLKFILSDIIFYIKDNITDNTFKILMETLSKITNYNIFSLEKH